MQIGGVNTTFCQEDAILLQKYRDRSGRCILDGGNRALVIGFYSRPILRPQKHYTSISEP